MKSFKKIIITGAVVLTALSVMVPKTFAANDIKASLQEEYDGEIYAKKMYEQLVEKFDNDSYYSRLVKAESNHANLVARAMAKLGYEAEEKEIDVVTSDDELTALKEALKFENDDVAAYESKIKNAENDIEKATYERLREGSKRHAASLERAIEDFEEDGIINHRFSGENRRMNRNENCNENCSGGVERQNRWLNNENSEDLQNSRQFRRFNDRGNRGLNCTGEFNRETRQNRVK